MVGLWVLLPVNKVLFRCDVEAVGEDTRSTMRGWAQAHQLWAELDRAVISVVRYMVQCDDNRHSEPR